MPVTGRRVASICAGVAARWAPVARPLRNIWRPPYANAKASKLEHSSTKPAAVNARKLSDTKS